MQQQGSEGLFAVLKRLQGLFLPLSHWETIVLPSRVTAYRKEYLDQLCASGEVLWIGRKEAEDKEGKVAFFLADAKPLYAAVLEQANARPTKHPELLSRIQAGGASFLTRLSREEGKPPSELLGELLELAWEGRVSNDQFAPLRLKIGSKSASWEKTGSGQGRWYATSSLTEDAEGPAASSGSLERQSASGAESPVLAWTHQLLNAYGLINKDLVAKTAPYSWDQFYPALKKLEEWGVLARGTFVKGDPHLQFTTRELSEAVRQPLPQVGEPQTTILSSADPANPFGILIDWPKSSRGASYSRKAGNFLALRGERWLYWIENNGKRIYPVEEDGSCAAEGEDSDPQGEAVELLQACHAIIRSRKLVKVKLEMWNGQPISDTAIGRELVSLGAERDMRALVVWSR
jgi:ATP-dependent Lhr-like helicase